MQQYRPVVIINVLTSVFPKAKPLGFFFFEGVIGVRVSRRTWENIPWMRRAEGGAPGRDYSFPSQHRPFTAELKSHFINKITANGFKVKLFHE